MLLLVFFGRHAKALFEVTAKRMAIAITACAYDLFDPTPLIQQRFGLFHTVASKYSLGERPDSAETLR